MELSIRVKEINNHTINILGQIYYKEEYVEKILRRQYEKGKKDGQQIHVAQIKECRNCKQK